MKPFFRNSSALLVAAGLSLAHAQEETTLEALPETTVQSEPTPPPRPAPPRPAPVEPPAPPTPPLVIDDEAPPPVSLTVPTIEEAAADLRLIPGGTAVVDAEDYRRGRATNLKDALDYAPGVFVQPRFGSEESRLSIRGSGIQRTFHGRGLKLLQDGVPLNLADGGFDFQAIEPLSAQYVEVYRGANGLEYGATTLGGAINFISHTGHTAPPLLTRFEYGSFDSIRGQIAGGFVDGATDGYASITHSSTDGFREHSQQSNQRFFGNVGQVLAPGVETRTWFTYARTDSELPGDLTKAQLNDDPTQAARVPAFLRGVPAVARFDRVTADWKRDFELFRVANRTTWESGEGTLSLGTFWSYKDLDHPILFVIDQVSNDFGIDLRYETTGDFLGRENHFVTGFAPTFGFTDDARFANVLGQRGAKFAESEQEAVNLDFYAQNIHYVQPGLGLVVGAQVSHAIRDNRDLFPTSPLDPDNSDRQKWTGFSPKVGVLYDAAPGVQFFANVSRSFEPPSFGELVNAANGGAGLVQLDAQTATTFEIGTRGETGRIAWDLAYYHAWVDDELLAFEVAPGLTQTVNADDTVHHGIEAAFDLELVSGLFTGSPGGHSTGGKSDYGKAPVEAWEDRIVVRTRSLWNDFRFDGDATFGDNPLPGIPSHYHRVDLLYEHPSGFYAGPNLEWVADSYAVDSAATEFADSYALLGLRVGVQKEEGLSVFVEAKNLTDEVYAATTGVVNNYAGQGIFMPGDGRSVYAGFEYRW